MMNPKVDWFFAKDTQWQKEYEKLRKIILDCGLIEELKWAVLATRLRTQTLY
jgi:uncharacterized protein YdeI (YjbR/CyaY-like superfamily)